MYLFSVADEDDTLNHMQTLSVSDDSPYIKYIKTKLMFVSKE